MRIQLISAPKTRVHFGESCDDGQPSLKEEKYYDLRYKFHLKEDTIKTNYTNDNISWRKMNKQLRKLAEREKACMDCLDNNFDANMRPIRNTAEKSQAVIDRAIAIRKANGFVAKLTRFIKSI